MEITMSLHSNHAFRYLQCIYFSLKMTHQKGVVESGTYDGRGKDEQRNEFEQVRQLVHFKFQQSDV